jgi:hypothetical protein
MTSWNECLHMISRWLMKRCLASFQTPTEEVAEPLVILLTRKYFYSWSFLRLFCALQLSRPRTKGPAVQLFLSSL